MKSNLFVFDTNTIISATLISTSTSRRAIDKAIDEGYLVFCEETIEELRSVIIRAKFDKYVSLDRRLVFLNGIEANALMQTVNTDFTICRDPKDNIFLSLAFDSKAECIVSGDSDLLILNPFNEISIITPTQFLEKYS